MTDMKDVGRLAMRHEGNFWNAYYAPLDTMENAVILGGIHMKFVQDEKRKLAFMKIMREAVGDLIEEATGQRPVWPEPLGHRAPESERAGHS